MKRAFNLFCAGLCISVVITALSEGDATKAILFIGLAALNFSFAYHS